MNRKIKKKVSVLVVMLFCFSLLGATPASAKTVTYIAPQHVFSINDVQGDNSGTYYGTDCLDMKTGQKDSKDGLTYYAIDSAYGFNVKDFDPSVAAFPRPVDGKHEEGWVANILDASGNVIGVKPKTPETPKYKTGALNGEWLGGLGGNMVKASTEHYVTMDHVLNAPWMPTLVEGVDYTIRWKDEGPLYRWGNYTKKPTEIRLYANIPLPEAWKQPGADYKVTSAKLVVKHTIANSPNDQIRPEGFGNHNATGILPKYTVAADGSWLSAVDSTEGDGHFIPAGTVLRDANGEYTNAWYTTLDRDPFAGPNPRWRLKGAKYGQDLPGVELPQYPVGELTTTSIDLLADMMDEATGQLSPSPFLSSKNWNAYLDEDGDGLGDDGGIKLTPNFDLNIYVKGEYKGAELYHATLIIEYEDNNAEPQPLLNDVTVSSLVAPDKVKLNSTSDIVVEVKNNLSGVASGTLTLKGTDRRGNVLGSFETDFNTTDNYAPTKFTYKWTAPGTTGDITWTAKVTAADDKDLSNNMVTAITKVVR